MCANSEGKIGRNDNKFSLSLGYYGGKLEIRNKHRHFKYKAKGNRSELEYELKNMKNQN